jgi:DNA adenine methylase
LRWAGGKNWLIKHIEDALSEFPFKNYHEPFLGGGSLFFSVRPDGCSFLSDLNPELVETYQVVKDNVSKLISELENYRNTKSFYYSVRKENFKSKIKRAARFVYLNQTSFNGIYRVNLEGVYNVPYGFRSKEFLESENLRSASRALKNAILESYDFDASLRNIKRGDLVFLDPPYTVSHNNNGFIKYNQKLFSLDDQYRLAVFIKSVKAVGAYYILTNAAHSKVEEIFGKLDDHVELSRASLIGGVNAKRGHVSEFLFSNIPKLKINSNRNGADR